MIIIIKKSIFIIKSMILGKVKQNKINTEFCLKNLMKIDNSNITRPVLGSSISAREKLLGAGHYTILIASL